MATGSQDPAAPAVEIPEFMRPHSARRSDDGVLCWIAARASQGWDWIDKRDIDKHVVSLIILYGSVSVIQWAMKFAEHGDRPGLEIAAIIAAVTAPYMALQAAALKFYFDSRTT